MTSITALLHTKNDALRLGRALETLYACDDILIVDHGSRDATVRVAREYGARVVDGRARSLASRLSSISTWHGEPRMDSVSRSARISDGEAGGQPVRVEVGLVSR